MFSLIFNLHGTLLFRIYEKMIITTRYNTIRYDGIEEFNVDLKAEYSA